MAIVLIMLGNLRGLRESGNIFAIPTYLFAVSTLLMIAIGVFRIVVLGEHARRRRRRCPARPTRSRRSACCC